jgi:acetyl-CoA carboxylase carboxyltransferase component
VINPRETRRVLCRDLELLANKQHEGPRKKHSNIPL